MSPRAAARTPALAPANAYANARRRTRHTARRIAWACCTVAMPWAAAQTQTQAQAQSQLQPAAVGGGQGLTIVPLLTAQETLTSNRDLTRNGQADAVTQISGGLRLSSRSGRLQGSLAYSANALVYARGADRNNIQNALDAGLRAELLENHLFLDGSATIAQQSISAFGTQGLDTTSRNANRTEVSTLSVTPTYRGSLGGFADVTLGANVLATRSDGVALGDSDSHNIFANVSGGTGFLGWGLNASQQTSSYKGGRSTQTDLLGGSLTYVARYDLRFTARAGTSRSDVLSGSDASKPTSGFSISWQPTERTTVALDQDKTYYGKSHSYNLVHRMPRAVWSYIDSAGSSGAPDGRQAPRPLTRYDLYFAICTLAGGDADSCERIVLAQLATEQIDRNTVVTLGFLNSSLTVQRSQLLSVSYAAMRTTFTLSATRNETRPLGQVPVVGDLSQGVPVRQQSTTLGISHQLLPGTAINTSISEQTTAGAGTLGGNRLQSLSLGLSTSPGPHTTLSANARHSSYRGAASTYTESALSASLGLRF